MIKQLEVSGKKSYEDFGLLIATRNISPPKKKSIKESVPFSNKVYDFSKINGEIYWEERTLEYSFDIAEVSTEEMEVVKTKAMNWLMNIHDEDIYDPYIGDYHFHGSYNDNSWSEDFGAGTISVTFSVYPYKISNTSNEVMELLEGELTIDTPATIENTSYSLMKGLTINGSATISDNPSPNNPSEIKTLDGINNLANYNDSVGYIFNFEIGDIINGKDYSLYLNVDGYIDFHLRYGNGGTKIETFYNVTGINVINFTATEDAILFLNGWTSGSGDFNKVPEIMLLEGNYTKDNVPKYVPYGRYLRVDTFSGNYLLNVNKYGWNENDATFEIIDDYLKIIMPLSPKRWSGVYCKNYGDDGLAMVDLLRQLKGKRCTYSFYARADKERTIYFQFGDDEVTYITLTTEWKRYSRTLTIGSQVPTFYCGTTYDTTTYYIKDIMLEDGETLNSYREHGEDTILVDMKKPNLFDLFKVEELPDNAFLSDDGIRVTQPTAGTYQWAVVTLMNSSDFLGKTLTIKCNSECSGTNDARIRIYWIKEDGSLGEQIKVLSATGGTFNVANSFPTGTNKVGFLFYSNYESETSVASDYVDYTNIELFEGVSDYYEVVKIDDVKDELIIDGSTTKITKKIVKIVLDGSEDWALAEKTDTFNGVFYMYAENYGIKQANSLCNIAIYDDYHYSRNEALFDLKYSQIRFVCPTMTMTVDEWKTLLNENPAILYAQLETPVEIELTNTELPYIFDDITMVTINDELNTTIDISYSEKKTLIINNNSSHRITPTIISEGNFTLTLNNVSYSIGSGTYNSKFHLESGVNEVVVTGTGRIAFRYVEELF